MAKLNQEYWYDFGQERTPYLVGKRQHFIKEDKSDIDTILNAIHNNKNEDYSNILEKNDSWWTFYHLSDMRNSLLSWYEFKPDAELLEIGGGFGALTGLFCDRCRNVIVTEEVLYRAKAIIDRYKNRNNLEVFAGRVDDIKPIHEKKFDYIIAVGVLEKRGDGWSEKAPYVRFLKKLLRLLKPDGKIILAVDNRYGIRNFCGARNWQTGKPFDGINRYPAGTKGYEFQKKELIDIIGLAGNIRYKFFYPLPDYRLAQLIYTDEYQNPSNIAERLEFYDFDQSTLVVAERNLYEDLISNGELSFHANSFLIELGEGEPSNASYAVISVDRGRERSFTTTIYQSENVIKRPVFSEGRDQLKEVYKNIMALNRRGISVICHVFKDGTLEMPYIKEQTLASKLKELVKIDTQKFIDLIDELYSNILRSSDEVDESKNRFLSEDNKGVDFGPILEYAFLDMVPVNCFIINERLSFFDQEFVYTNCPARFVLYRALKYTYMSMWNMEEYLSLDFFREKYQIQDKLWEVFEKEEEKFISSLRNYAVYAQFQNWKKIDEFAIRKRSDQLENVVDTVSYNINSNTDAIRNVELQLLKKFLQVCDKYGLQYYGIQGTLLGAVRYKGFIPWDDNIEIAMMRQDYDQLLLVADEEFKTPYFLQTMGVKENFYGGHCKLRNSNTTAIYLKQWKGNKGISIDIFPLDFCCIKAKENERLREKISFCQKLIITKIYDKSDYFDYINEREWKRIEKYSEKIPLTYLFDKLDQLFRCGSPESNKVAIFAKMDWNRQLVMYNKELFENSKLMKFESLNISVPLEYSLCLEQEGIKFDILPKLEDRHPKREGWLIATDVPYKIYEERFIIQKVVLEIKEDMQIVLIGNGELLDDYLYYNNTDYPPSLVIDICSENWGRCQYGYEIQPIEKLDDIVYDKKIIICHKNFRKYEKFLWSKGIYDYKIYIPTILYAVYSEE